MRTERYKDGDRIGDIEKKLTRDMQTERYKDGNRIGDIEKRQARDIETMDRDRVREREKDTQTQRERWRRERGRLTAISLFLAGHKPLLLLGEISQRRVRLYVSASQTHTK